MKLLFRLHSHTLLNFSLREFLVERKSKGRAKGDSVHLANRRLLLAQKSIAALLLIKLANAHFPLRILFAFELSYTWSYDIDPSKTMQDQETTSSALYRTSIKHLHSHYSNLPVGNLHLNSKCELSF